MMIDAIDSIIVNVKKPVISFQLLLEGTSS